MRAIQNYPLEIMYLSDVSLQNVNVVHPCLVCFGVCVWIDGDQPGGGPRV